jgi:hypothetical protein
MGAVLLAFVSTGAVAAESHFPPGWGGGSHWPNDYEFGAAAVEGAHGKAAYIRARSSAAHNGYFIMTQCIDAQSTRGQRLRFSGRLRTVSTSAGQLWMQVYRGRFALTSDMMYDRQLKGSNDWQRREIVLNVPADSTRVCYGFLLNGGEGEVWADDLMIEKVGFNVPSTTTFIGPVVNFGGGIYSLSHGGLGRMDER